MIIDTTVNMNIETRIRLAAAIEITGASREELISALLRYVGRSTRVYGDAYRRVRYQERKPGQEWRKVHLRLKYDEYEFFSDVRKLFKWSVSYAIAWALSVYFDEIVALIKGNPDKYRYRNYLIKSFSLEGINCFIICWGIPLTIGTIIQLE
jgi:hypothetical protein